ncbi:MAG: hypothetical protein WCC57_07035, partial [Paracoccaceae bacterium]
IYVGEGVALTLDDPIYGLVGQYLEAMGVHPFTVVGWMFQAGPADMYEPDVRMLCAPSVATFVQRICDANGNF